MIANGQQDNRLLKSRGNVKTASSSHMILLLICSSYLMIPVSNPRYHIPRYLELKLDSLG